MSLLQIVRDRKPKEKKSKTKKKEHTTQNKKKQKTNIITHGLCGLQLKKQRDRDDIEVRVAVFIGGLLVG